ncbi:hypothetical protein ZWY2020_007855 [Hordeum vulgare]|nr:hypothetical protein ZWY2020_007855 [Hordeum vulgare]
MSKGVYASNFPFAPPHPFNYTGTPPNNTNVMTGTKALVLPFGTAVELVMQDTSILGAESHPLHLRLQLLRRRPRLQQLTRPGPGQYNLVDPVRRNTVGVPAGGWVSSASEPTTQVYGSCIATEVHMSWGLKMAWLVLDGNLPNQKLPPPPADLRNARREDQDRSSVKKIARFVASLPPHIVIRNLLLPRVQRVRLNMVMCFFLR